MKMKRQCLENRKKLRVREDKIEIKRAVGDGIEEMKKISRNGKERENNGKEWKGKKVKRLKKGEKKSE